MRKDRKIENFLKLQSNFESIFAMYFDDKGISRWEMQEIIKELIQYKYLSIEDVKGKSSIQIESLVLIQISKYALHMKEDKVEKHLWRVQNFILEQGNRMRTKKIIEDKVIKFLDSLSMKEAQELGDINKDIYDGNISLVREEDSKGLEDFCEDLIVDVVE